METQESKNNTTSKKPQTTSEEQKSIYEELAKKLGGKIVELGILIVLCFIAYHLPDITKSLVTIAYRFEGAEILTELLP